jgi:hypothetical protein
MYLRKPPQRTPKWLAAARDNAQHSTGPRTPAGKANTKMNALKHGRYAALENHQQVMLALGEDPEEFEFLKQELMTSFGPGDALWKNQIEDLAKLYWRRARLERAQTGVMRRALQAVEDRQHRRRLEMAGATFGATQREMLDLSLPEPSDPDVRLRRILSSLEVIREQAKQRAFWPRLHSALENLYQSGMGWRAGRICRLLRLFCDPSELRERQEGEDHQKSPRETADSSEQAGEPQYKELLRLLDDELASVREEFEYAEKANEEKAAIERDACLAPDGEACRMMLRQEAALDRSIDRKVRILLSLRKEYSDYNLAASIAPDDAADPESNEIKKMLGIDIASETPATEKSVGTPKMEEQSRNVYENKGALWKTSERSRNVHEKTGA